MSLPELQQNPLVQRVIEIFDTDGNKEIDFKGMYHKFLCHVFREIGRFCSFLMGIISLNICTIMKNLVT